MLTILYLRRTRVQISFLLTERRQTSCEQGFSLVSCAVWYAVGNRATVYYSVLFKDVKEAAFQPWSRQLFLFPMSVGSLLNFGHVLTITTLALVILTADTFSGGWVLNNELYERSTLSRAILCRSEQKQVMSAVSFARLSPGFIKSVLQKVCGCNLSLQFGLGISDPWQESIISPRVQKNFACTAV